MPQAWMKGRRNPRRSWHIKVGDEVIILSGDDKGKTGKVLAVFPEEAKVIVEGINIQKRHQKLPGQESGSITDRPGKMWIWKVSRYVEINGKNVPTRVKKDSNGKKIAIKNNEILE